MRATARRWRRRGAQRRWPSRRGSDPARGLTGGPLLDTGLLRQLELLSLDSLGAIIAGLQGERSGVRRSQRADFADYRSYQPGDDLRLMDWNAYLRLDELHVRTSFAPQGLTLSLLLDCSRSMAPVAPGTPDKLHYAKRVAAALGAIGLLYSDTVRIYALGDGQARPTPLFTGRHALGAFLESLERLPVLGGTGLADCVRSCRRGADTLGIAVLLSDLLIPRAHDEALGWLGPSGAVLQIVDPGAAIPPPGSGVEMRDAETADVVTVTVTPLLRQHYQELFDARSAELARRCASSGLRYSRLDVGTPIADLLFGPLYGHAVLSGGI